jgi:hypothetical protein
VAQNGLTSGQPATVPGARACRWQKNADTSGDGYLVSVNIYDQAGLDQLNTTSFDVTNYPVGSHQGRLSKEKVGGACAVSIEVTSTSRVDIGGVDGQGRQQQACTVAETVAPSVAQKLPLGNG